MRRRELLANLITAASACAGMKTGIQAAAFDKEKPPDLIILSLPYPMNDEEWLRFSSEARHMLDSNGFENTKLAIIETARLTVPSNNFVSL